MRLQMLGTFLFKILMSRFINILYFREKNFIIRGSPDAVERAKAMIMEKIGMPVTASTFGNYGGSSGGSSWGGGAPGYPGGGGGYPNESGNVNPPGGQPADYSAQWAEYYRSVGMLREAEAIEQQMRVSFFV